MQPEGTKDLAQMIAQADAPLSVIGGGTRLLPGEGQGVRLSTKALTGITLYEPEALTLVVRAGTLLSEVTAALAAEGQMLAFEPDPRPGSTIGGVVAANASGPRRVQVGGCRDALIGVEFVDGQGQIIRNGGRVMKNVTGYDLVKLMAGSRGTLGVLTECAFKTAPLPQASVTLVLPDLDAALAVDAMTRALGGAFDVSAAGWRAGLGAMIRLEGLAGSVALRQAALKIALAEFGRADLHEGRVWQGQPDCPEFTDLWRILCRPSEAAGLLAHLSQPLALDWGGALIWAAMPAGVAPDLPRWSGHAQRVQGSGPMILPAPNPVIARLNRDIRATFDPSGRFRGDN